MEKNALKKATESQINAWEKKHGKENIFCLAVEKEVDGKTQTFEGWFQKPTLNIILAAQSYAGGDQIKEQIKTFDLCLLGGDSRVAEDDEIKFAMSYEVVKSFKILKATLVKK